MTGTKDLPSINLPREVLDTCRELAAKCGYQLPHGPHAEMGNLVALLRAVTHAYEANPDKTVATLRQLVGQPARE